MDKPRKRPLADVKSFFDPHPGFAGAAIPIPPAVKRVADELAGKEMSLRDALQKIRAVTSGKVEIVENDPEYLWISLHITDRARREHLFRVIRFR